MTPFWAQGQALEVSAGLKQPVAGLKQPVAGPEQPVALRWEKRDHPIRTISTHWRVHIRWWAESEIFRDYWEVTTETGLLCVLYQDLLEGSWYLERIYA